MTRDYPNWIRVSSQDEEVRRYYPSWILFRARHDDNVPPRVLCEEYGKRLQQVGLADLVAYSIAGMDGERALGTEADLKAAIAGYENGQQDSGNPHYFDMVFRDGTEVTFVRGQGGEQFWKVEGHYPPETKPTVDWMRRMAQLGALVPTVPGFSYAVLRREQSLTRFVPEPPLARANHLTTVTERQVVEAYDTPDYFWKMWDRVETVGDVRVCIRDLDALDDDSWLTKTFESTMGLVRLAKPKLTTYDMPSRIVPAFAPWWEYGDFQDEKAGTPALAYVGYETATRTVELTGFVTSPPYARGGDNQRHVLIREIHELRALVKAKKDAEGRPIDTVRIVFPFEWMARQERRPLLDAGARVFYTTRDSVDLIEVTE